MRHNLAAHEQRSATLIGTRRQARGTNVTRSVPLEQSEEGRAFLQRRVALAGLFGGVVGLAFLMLRTGEALLHQHLQEFSSPDYWLHIGGTLSMASVWLICATGRRAVQVVRAAETIGLLAACIFYSAMASYLPEWQMPHYIVLLALQVTFVARAIYVPSTALRTFSLTIAAGVPILAATYWTYVDIDVDDWRHFEGIARDATASMLALGATASAALWWAATVAMCAGASRVIYGLRRQVRDVRKLGQYELVQKLGEGGMGVVYRAEHAMLRRPTAVKLLPPDKAGEPTLARFEKEVQQTARLTHPNTVTVFDYGRTPEGVFYYAMEYLEGATLSEIVEMDGPQPAARVAHVLEQAACALAEAHGVGLIHRDIKPANIMLVKQGGELDVTKILDFGLVKELSPQGDLALTQADTITGTPHYLSPEGINQRVEVDARSDLYALGAVGYFLITGSHVFPGSTIVEVLAMHLHTEPESPSKRLDRQLPRDLEALILQCLSKAPGQRPRSALEFVRGLRACRDFDRWTPEDADQWWERCGGVLAERHASEADTVTGRTLAIDLAHREGLKAVAELPASRRFD